MKVNKHALSADKSTNVRNNTYKIKLVNWLYDVGWRRMGIVENSYKFVFIFWEGAFLRNLDAILKNDETWNFLQKL